MKEKASRYTGGSSAVNYAKRVIARAGAEMVGYVGYATGPGSERHYSLPERIERYERAECESGMKEKASRYTGGSSAVNYAKRVIARAGAEMVGYVGYATGPGSERHYCLPERKQRQNPHHLELFIPGS